MEKGAEIIQSVIITATRHVRYTGPPKQSTTVDSTCVELAAAIQYALACHSWVGSTVRGRFGDVDLLR